MKTKFLNKKRVLFLPCQLFQFSNSENVEKHSYYHYYSHYEKGVNLIGWILIFLRKCTWKEFKKQGNLDPEEFFGT